MITADFSAAAVLITFGAVLGKVSRLQLLVIAFIEIIMFTVNEFILLQELEVADAGGSMVIHCFGAYFGLGLAFALQRPADTDNNPKEGSVYHSDLFAIIGRFKNIAKIILRMRNCERVNNLPDKNYFVYSGDSSFLFSYGCNKRSNSKNPSGNLCNPRISINYHLKTVLSLKL